MYLGKKEFLHVVGYYSNTHQKNKGHPNCRRLKRQEESREASWSLARLRWTIYVCRPCLKKSKAATVD